MRGQVALIREQGQQFAVLAVRGSALNDPHGREELLRFCRTEFGARSALLGDDGRTCGPPDILNWLRGVTPDQLPWREFTANN